MTVTVAIRFSVPNLEVATTESKRAKAMWTKAGASDFRAKQMFSGPYFGQWLFEIDFTDLAHFQRCRDVVINSDDMKTIIAANAKAGNKMEAREMLFGLDV